MDTPSNNTLKHKMQNDGGHELMIAAVRVKQDKEGRFCLNDIRIAATKYQAMRTNVIATYLRRKSTRVLIAVIVSQGKYSFTPVVTTEGWGGSTFVCKELVLDYALGISPSFFEVVSQALTQKIKLSVPSPQQCGSKKHADFNL